MKVISFMSVKGGVGKTTLTVNTANELASKVGGKDRVLIVDLDAQAGATIYLLGHERQRNLEKEGNTVYKLLDSALKGEVPDVSSVIIPVGGEWSSRLYLIPSDSRVTGLESQIVAGAAAKGSGWLNIMRRLLSALKDSEFNYYVFIDPPATFGVFSRMTLAAVDYFVLPIVPDDFGRASFRLLKGEFFTEIVNQIVSEGRSDRPLCGGVVFNKVEPTGTTQSKIADEIAEEVSKARLYGKYPIPVYKTKLGNYIVYVSSLEKHVPLAKVKDSSKSSKNAVEQFKKYFDEFYEYVVKDGVKRMVEGG